MSLQRFNAQDVLSNLRQKQAVKKPERYHKSKLDPYWAELLALRQAGASYLELATWLCEVQRIRVSHTTVMRYLNKLVELE